MLFVIYTTHDIIIYQYSADKKLKIKVRQTYKKRTKCATRNIKKNVKKEENVRKAREQISMSDSFLFRLRQTFIAFATRFFPFYLCLCGTQCFFLFSYFTSLLLFRFM